jgi:hypothetical protein
MQIIKLLLTISLALAGTVQAQTFLTNGLVAYYPFNGNANDASGNGNNGIIYGATFIANRFGQPNSALSFNGTSSYAIVPWNPLFGGSNSTVSVWIKVNSYPIVANPTLVSVILGQALGVPDIGIATNLLLLAKNAGSSTDWDSCYTDLPVPLNNYEHVVGCFTPTNLAIYQNGTLVAQATSPNRMVHVCPGSPLYIGGVNIPSGSCAGPYSSEYFSGIIDDIRIYNRVLSAAEVQQLYQLESAPQLSVIKAVKPSFSTLWLGTNYQLQVSGDLNTWTNQGSPFTATNTSMDYPQYWDVDNWNKLFFRLQVTP